MSIRKRYGIEPPMTVLRRLLVERLGEPEAAVLLEAYQEAARRYQRAVRVEAARCHLERWRGHRPSHIDRQYARWQLLVQNAQAYIAGVWTVPRRLELETIDEQEQEGEGS